MTDPVPLRVLIADDEASILKLVSRVLSRGGFDPVESFDGQDAIEKLDADRFDAVVLDLMMPRVDGFGVMKHIIETRPELMEKTIVMTAYPKAALKERVHQLCSVVSKPFEVAELLSMVRACAHR